MAATTGSDAEAQKPVTWIDFEILQSGGLAVNVIGAGPRARLTITAHGLYEARINGERVGDQVFTPGYTP